jgi:hypothetical protein
MVFYLSKTVVAHGDRVDKLSLREPTVADIERHGNPIELRWNNDGTYVASPVAKAMVPMLADLAAVNHQAIRTMSVADYQGIATLVASFFLPAWGLTPRSPSSSPTS